MSEMNSIFATGKRYEVDIKMNLNLDVKIVLAALPMLQEIYGVNTVVYQHKP